MQTTAYKGAKALKYKNKYSQHFFADIIISML